MPTIQIDKFLENDIYLFFVIFSVTLIGSFVKDIFTSGKSRKKVSLKMIYSSTFIVTILLYASSEWILAKFPGRSFLGVCVITGLLSVELTRRLTTIEGIKKIIAEFLEYKRNQK